MEKYAKIKKNAKVKYAKRADIYKYMIIESSLNPDPENMVTMGPIETLKRGQPVSNHTMVQFYGYYYKSDIEIIA